MKLRHYALALLVPLLWGLNYIAASVALEKLPPFLLLALRFGVVALVVLPFAPRPPLPFRQIAAVSLLLGTLHFGLNFLSLWMGLSLSGAIVAGQLGVPFSCLLSGILFSDRLGRWRSLGMLISFLGVLLVAGTPQVASEFTAFLVACASTLAWGVSNVLMKKAGTELRILPLMGWVSLCSVPQLALLSFVFEEGQMQAIQAAAWPHWAALAYTIIASTLVAYGAWYWLMARFPVSQVTPFSLLIPVFGLAATRLVYGEAMTTQFLTGTALTILGVGIIILRKPRLGG
jgi:O-acetylserine/cysteine efflux transporter